MSKNRSVFIGVYGVTAGERALHWATVRNDRDHVLLYISGRYAEPMAAARDAIVWAELGGFDVTSINWYVMRKSGREP